jgi:hypothetical protein
MIGVRAPRRRAMASSAAPAQNSLAQGTGLAPQADDSIQFGNGTGPAPRRRMFASPFGSLPASDTPIQYGDAGTGPAPRPAGVNALASPQPTPRPIAAPFGALQTPTYDPPPPPSSPAPGPSQPMPVSSPENTEDDGLALARWLGLPDTRVKVPTPYDPAPYDDTPAATQSAAPVDSINALLQSLRRY